ncbi:MAG: gamma carbonic anhydrase family protein [Deltaproteobacteria bacterium]|nr:MAG: gamma carbonic anhydrase family protein [Deltaproteobacteria bacterium]
MPVYKLSDKQPIIDATSFIAPTASLIGDIVIGKHSSVWFNTVLRGDMNRIQIGDDTNIQDFTMGHVDSQFPLTVGNNVTVGHHCMIHGCTIEDECLIGIGASVLNGAIIGRGSIVASGAIVLENTKIPPFSLVVGIPGKVKRTFDETPDIIPYSTKAYQELARKYTDPNEFFTVDNDKH